ncbi:MAG: hypothetical protein WC659_02055 [Patescibacteria group bacterium]
MDEISGFERGASSAWKIIREENNYYLLFPLDYLAQFSSEPEGTDQANKEFKSLVNRDPPLTCRDAAGYKIEITKEEAGELLIDHNN